MEETEKKLGDLRIDVENLQSCLIEPQTDKKLAEAVQPDVVLLDQNHTELQKLQREIDRLEAKLPAGSKWKTLIFYVLLTVHLDIILFNGQLDAQFFFVYVYFSSLHVSSIQVLIIRRFNCINMIPGICHSM